MSQRTASRGGKIVAVIRDHLSSAVIGGLFLMLTGFTPEDLFVHAIHALHLSGDTLKKLSLGLDPRLLLVLTGVLLIVGDFLLRRRNPTPQKQPPKAARPIVLWKATGPRLTPRLRSAFQNCLRLPCCRFPT